MNHDEIAKKLRSMAENSRSKHDVLVASADLHESQQACIAELERQLAEIQRSKPRVSKVPCCVCGGEVVEFTVPNDLWNFVMRPDGKETGKEYLCWDCWNKALWRKMQELQRETQAAVEDMRKLIFETAKEPCDLCIEVCANYNGTCASGVLAGFSGKCRGFAYRGPQEARKGEPHGTGTEII